MENSSAVQQQQQLAEDIELPVEAREFIRFDISDRSGIRSHLDEYGFVIVANAADEDQVIFSFYLLFTIISPNI